MVLIMTRSNAKKVLYVICMGVGAIVAFGIISAPPLAKEEPYYELRTLADTIRQDLQKQPHEIWEAIYHGGYQAIDETESELFLSTKKGLF